MSLIGRRSLLGALPVLPLVPPAGQAPGSGDLFRRGSFGARGDGRADDPATLQAALDAAETSPAWDDCIWSTMLGRRWTTGS